MHCSIVLRFFARKGKLTQININATKLNVPTQILYLMIRILYEVVLAKIFGNKMLFWSKK